MHYFKSRSGPGFEAELGRIYAIYAYGTVLAVLPVHVLWKGGESEQFRTTTDNFLCQRRTKMAIEKAKAFVSLLKSDKKLQEKMKGFTLDEFKTALKEAKGELSDSDLDSLAGGGGFMVSW
jgi:hypothetical protein